MAQKTSLAVRQFTALLGLPDDPIAVAFAERLLALNTKRSAQKTRRVKDELWGVLQDAEVVPQIIAA